MSGFEKIFVLKVGAASDWIPAQPASFDRVSFALFLGLRLKNLPFRGRNVDFCLKREIHEAAPATVLAANNILRVDQIFILEAPKIAFGRLSLKDFLTQIRLIRLR